MNTAFSVDADFAGGNIIVERIVDDEVFLRQDLRDTVGDWFYWAFRVRGGAGRNLKFHFTGSDVVGVRGPAISMDKGLTWQWLGAGDVSRSAGENTSFVASVPANISEVIFALCPLYTQNHLDVFLSKPDIHASVGRQFFCLSRTGREVEMLRLGSETASYGVLFSCRHHACETMASYCLEGFIEAVVSEDALGQWLRENVNFAAVPFMDKDGVEAGDQGKNRRPYDHNRDYGGEISDSIYPEVRALRGFAPAWCQKHKTNLLFDFHCPWLRGEYNEEIYFVGGPDAQIWERVEQFSALLEEQCSGPISFGQSHNLPHGVGWNVLDGNAIGGCTFAKWASELPGVGFATTLEVPYANAGGTEVTPQSCRALGRDLAATVQRYLLSISPNSATGPKILAPKDEAQ